MSNLNEPDSFVKEHGQSLPFRFVCAVSLCSQALGPDSHKNTPGVCTEISRPQNLPKLGPPKGHTFQALSLQPLKQVSGMAWLVARGLHRGSH